MKIAKELLKIAHELDANGICDLADSIESIALSLAHNGIEKFARAGNWQTMVDMIGRDSTNPNEAAAALNRVKAFVAKGKAPPEALEQAEKAMSARKVPPPSAATSTGSKQTARLREIAQKGKPSSQMSVQSLTAKDVAAKTNPNTARPLADRAKGAIKGFKPINFLSGAVGAGAGAYVGSELGSAIGGDAGAETGAQLGGLIGGAASRTPQGLAVMLALAGGWAIGTAINEAGLGNKIQQALSAEEDASMEVKQLKAMVEIFDKTAATIDHPGTPVEKKVQKILNIENLVNRIIEHPAASSMLGQDGLAKFKDFKARMDSAISKAAASAPAAVSATNSPRKTTPSPAIRKLQENLNKLNAQGSIQLDAPLAVDGIVGPKTRAALLAFDPASRGKVTADLIDRVSTSANYKGGDGFGGG